MQDSLGLVIFIAVQLWLLIFVIMFPIGELLSELPMSFTLVGVKFVVSVLVFFPIRVFYLT